MSKCSKCDCRFFFSDVRSSLWLLKDLWENRADQEWVGGGLPLLCTCSPYILVLLQPPQPRLLQRGKKENSESSRRELWSSEDVSPLFFRSFVGKARTRRLLSPSLIFVISRCCSLCKIWPQPQAIVMASSHESQSRSQSRICIKNEKILLHIILFCTFMEIQSRETCFWGRWGWGCGLCACTTATNKQWRWLRPHWVSRLTADETGLSFLSSFVFL